MKSFTNEETAVMYELLCEYKERDTVDLRQKVVDFLNNFNKKQRKTKELTMKTKALVKNCCEAENALERKNEEKKLWDKLNKIFLNFRSFLLIGNTEIVIHFTDREKQVFTIDELEKIEKTILD